MAESMERRAPVPVVTYALVGLNVGVYLFTTLVREPPGSLGVRGALDWGGFYGPYVLDGQWFRIPMSMFLHLGFDHLVGNMIALLLAGFPAERLFGSLTFGVLYVVCGIAGAMASLVVHPGFLFVGASAAVLGTVAVVLGFLLRMPGAREYVRMLRGFWTAGIGLLVYSVLMAELQRFGAFANVGHAANTAGVLLGLGLGYVIVRPALEEDEAPRRRAALSVAFAGIVLLVSGLLLTPHVDDALSLMLDIQETEAEIRAEAVWKPDNSWYVR